jgi:hypothetical protein
LLYLRGLAFPAREQLDEFLIQLDDVGWAGGYRHDGRARLDGLAGLVVLLCVLREEGEVGLEAAHVAGVVSLVMVKRKVGYSLYVFLGWLRLVALWLAVCGLPYLASLTLALEIAYLFYEDRVDLEERGHPILVARLCNRRYRRQRDSLHGRLSLRGLCFDLAHGLLLAVGGHGGMMVLLLVLMLVLGRRIRLAGGARGRGGLAVLGKLLVGGRGQGLGVRRGRVLLHRGCSMAGQCQHRIRE